MKKGILTLFVLFIVSGLYAQDNNMGSKSTNWEWAPIGAVWMYKTNQMIFDSPPYNNLEYYWYVRSEKDTIINGQNCRKLTVEKFTNPYSAGISQNPRFGYMEDGFVYLYNYQGEFQPVYKYNVNAGDTITLYSPLFSENCFSTYIVDSVTEREAGEWTDDLPALFSNIAIQEYQLSRISGNCWPFNVNHPSIGEYLTYSGSTYDEMCPSTEILEEIRPKFSCYYDGNVTIYNTNYNVIDSCISYYNETLDLVSNQDNNIKIYPNPVKRYLTIDNSSSFPIIIEIFNVAGNLCYKNIIKNNVSKLDLNMLMDGLYIVNLKYIDCTMQKKIIKTD